MGETARDKDLAAVAFAQFDNRRFVEIRTSSSHVDDDVEYATTKDADEFTLGIRTLQV
jgi:hypothetical protein